MKNKIKKKDGRGRPKGSTKKKIDSDLERKKQIIEREEKILNTKSEEKIIETTGEIKEEPKPEIKEEQIIEIKIEETFKPKPGEEVFDEFLSSFKDVTKEENDKLIESKIEVEENLQTIKEENEEENEDEEDEQPRQKRKYTKRKNVTSNYSEDENKILEANAAFFNGTMLISLCDFLFPSVIKFVFKNLLKNKSAAKIKHSQLVLNSDQLESIEEVSDAAARVIFEKINPIVMFIIGMSVMYFMNFRMALDEQEEKDKLLIPEKK